MRIQRFLDPHDVIKIQSQTESAVTNAEAAENVVNIMDR